MVQPAKSARLQIHQGNPNKKNMDDLRRRSEQEEKLKMKNDSIIAPSWLDAVGKSAFEFIKEELLSVELIENPDIHVLAMYCSWYSEYVKLNKQLKSLRAKHKKEYKNQLKAYEEDGSEITMTPEIYGNPLSRHMDTCSKNIRQFGNDLGLSPSARAKLAIKLADNDAENDESDY